MGKYHKKIKIDLNGPNFSIFYVIGKVLCELKNRNIPKEDFNSFRDELISIEPDYYKVLDVCRKWVKIKDYLFLNQGLNWTKIQNI